jgi:hypothetical protein
VRALKMYSLEWGISPGGRGRISGSSGIRQLKKAYSNKQFEFSDKSIQAETRNTTSLRGVKARGEFRGAAPVKRSAHQKNT